jgi:ABC-type phosphate/phosphonate transport system permease subunit
MARRLARGIQLRDVANAGHGLPGDLVTSLAAVPLGFLGARNVVPQWLFHFGLRRIYDGIRGVDALLWALMFVNVVGLGPSQV